jgi:DNA-binding Lrp family transcriptional regulator
MCILSGDGSCLNSSPGAEERKVSQRKSQNEIKRGIPQNMDRLDVEILRRLGQDARKSYLEIARELKVANATVHERISKLREKGILKGFYAQMSAEKLGCPIIAFVGLITSQNRRLPRLVEKLKQFQEIEEAHTVTGKYDFLIKLRARSNEELQELLNKIGSIPGVGRHETMMALTTILEREVPFF